MSDNIFYTTNNLIGQWFLLLEWIIWPVHCKSMFDNKLVEKDVTNKCIWYVSMWQRLSGTVIKPMSKLTLPMIASITQFLSEVSAWLPSELLFMTISFRLNNARCHPWCSSDMPTKTQLQSLQVRPLVHPFVCLVAHANCHYIETYHKVPNSLTHQELKHEISQTQTWHESQLTEIPATWSEHFFYRLLSKTGYLVRIIWTLCAALLLYGNGKIDMYNFRGFGW